MIDKPLIVPIAQTHINWDGFVKAIQEQTNRSPLRILDQMSMRIGDIGSYILALAAFSNNVEIKSALIQRPFLFGHLFFSFLITPTTNEYIEILREGYIQCIDNMNTNDEQLIVIMSGTASQWHDSCKVFCTAEYNFRVRFIFDCIFLYLEKLKIFSDTKKFLTDETFTL